MAAHPGPTADWALCLYEYVSARTMFPTATPNDVKTALRGSELQTCPRGCATGSTPRHGRAASVADLDRADSPLATPRYDRHREEEPMKANSRSHRIFAGVLAALLLSVPVAASEAQSAEAAGQAGVHEAGRRQLILWTSGDREVALKMVFMYAYNAKKRGWMDTVRLLVWGPSSKLLSEDAELQEQLAGLNEVGVELYACKACAEAYGVAEKLSSLDIEVMYTGKMLAELQQQGWHVLTI
jgi:hypothetical protein